MADPVSLAASIVTLTSIIHATCQGIQRVRELKKAPKRISEVYNKTQELNVVLNFVLSAAQTSSINDGSTIIRFLQLVERARETIEEADRLVKTWVKNPEVLDVQTQAVKAKKLRFLKDDKKLKAIVVKLSEIRESLSITLSSLSAHQLSAIRLTLRAVESNAQQQHQCDRCVEPALFHRISEIRDDSERPAVNHQAHHPSSLLSDTSSFPNGSADSATTYIEVEAEVTQASALNICGCRCHSPLAMRTPDWVGNAVGVLLVRWFKGSNTCERCSRGSCSVTDRPALLTRYYFPRWMMWRLIEIDSALTTSRRISFSIRSTSVIPDESTIFTFIQHNNLAGVKRLFAQGLASPFDVSMKGRTPLHFAASSVQVEMVDFLVKQRAEMHAEDHNLLSPSDAIWEIYFRNPQKRESLLAAAGLSLNDLNDTESLEKLSLTGLHRIVLGLTEAMDLRDYCKVSTLEIDVRDWTGKTALAWAASRKATRTVQTLLDSKASVSISDNRRKTPLHYSAGTGTASAVEIILQVIKGQEKSLTDSAESLIEAGDDKGRTPLNYATRKNLPDHTRILLDYGSNVQARDTDVGRTILLNALYWNSYDVLPMLLARGARTDVQDFNGATVLHYLARFSDLQTLQIMAEHNLGSIDSSVVDHSGLTALDIFNSTDARCIPEDGPERELAVKLFLRILRDTARRRASELLMTGEVGIGQLSISKVTDVFEISDEDDAQIGSTSSDSDDEQVFYDAVSRPSIGCNMTGEDARVATACSSYI